MILKLQGAPFPPDVYKDEPSRMSINPIEGKGEMITNDTVHIQIQVVEFDVIRVLPRNVYRYRYFYSIFASNFGFFLFDHRQYW